MPGKRSRQIQRSTSMSLLGSADGGCFRMGARFSQTVPESFFEGGLSSPEDAASLHRELSPPPRQLELLDHMEICANAGDAQSMEGTHNHMFIDGSIEESLLASHATQQDAHYPAHQDIGLGPTHPTLLGDAYQAAAHSYHMNAPAHSKAMAFFRGQVSPGSAQPAHFLDVCFLCSKRLGHGKDVFIYRGDRAYCSAECRHAQIAADERREKCGQTSVKGRAGVNIPVSDGPLLA